ncbi:pilus assembly protein [Undibacterium sp.]|uniref:pilus assembly protein n=1 Tax=Undibacterium sp. TaxID=1914977 RepID=UPI0037503948
MHTSSFLIQHIKLVFKLAFIGAISLLISAQAQQPAQDPLLSRTQSVRPNLSLMFDDSGSMQWHCSYTANVNTQVALNTNTLGPIGIDAGCLNTGSFVKGGATRTLSAFSPIYISPQNNLLSYDPNKRYIPPFVSPTTRAQAATVTVFFPLATNVRSWTGTSPNLTPTAYIAPTENFPTNLANEPTGTVRITHFPRANFSVDSANLTNLQLLANYDSIAIGTTSFYVRRNTQTFYVDVGTVNPLLKTAVRSDCVANADYCTVAEEQQNIANWQLYYRDRIKAFRSGVAEAFNGLPDSFRFNYSTLGNALTRLDKDNNRVDRTLTDFAGISTMTNYGIAIAPFYTWLYNPAGDGFNNVAAIGTPLRSAYDRVGSYYNRNVSNAGPWGDTPWAPGSELASAHLSCRKSFAILATDGFWNGATPASVNNLDTDGTTGPLIADNPTGATYRYVPGAVDPWARGKRDNITTNSGNQSTLADVALYYWMNDLRPNESGTTGLLNNITDGSFQRGPFWQNLNLTTVAFGANGQLSDVAIAPATSQLQQARAGTRNWPVPVANTSTALDDLAHAAHNGGGDFLAVSDSQAFAERLRNKLLDIASEDLTQAGVVGSSQSLSAGTVKIEANYVSGKWWGNLSAIILNPVNGREIGPKWRVTEVNASNIPTGTSTIPPPSQREIYTYVSSATAPIPFNHTALQTNGLIGTGTMQLTSTWSSAQTDFIRGVRTNEGDGKAFRARDALLGDIVNSTPAFVKNTIPSTYNNWGSASDQAAYKAYRADKAARTDGLILVGANDGMLHAFREQDGREIFAYIPRAVLPHLHRLTQKDYAINHRYYVDGPLNEVDAYITTPNASGAKSLRWSNLVLGSTGAGAKAVFALDVTQIDNLRNDDILWEINAGQTAFTDDLGYITQRISAGVTASGDWVGVFGNGAGSASGLAKLFIVNLETGALIKKIDTDSTTGNGLSGVRLVRNTKGAVIGAYAGDLKGRMWRFDLSAASNTAWPSTAELLFTAPSTSASGTTTAVVPAITAPPSVVKRTDNRDGYMVVFGTGKLLNTSDLATPYPLQRNYGIWDTAPFGGTVSFVVAQFANLVPSIISVTSSGTATAASIASDATLYSVETSGPIDWTTKRGWYMDLTLADGQRLIYPSDILNGLVQLQTVAPRISTANSCTNDGLAKGYNFVIDPTRGGCRSGKTLDTNQDNAINENDTSACGISTIGDGENENFCKGDCGNGGLGGVPDGGSSTEIIKESNCENEFFYTVDTTTRAQLLKTCEKPPPADPTGVFRRTVRQVFIRP